MITRIILSIILPVLFFFGVSFAANIANNAGNSAISNLLYPASDFLQFWPVNLAIDVGLVETMLPEYTFYSQIISIVILMALMFSLLSFLSGRASK